MQAVICAKYGEPDVLEVKQIPTPVPKANEALVQVRASSVNAADVEILRGAFVSRMISPFKPPHPVLGTDVSGVITGVGKNVTRFKPGDEIWGDLSVPLKSGAFAEYVCVPEYALRLKPAGMSFEEAAAIPTAGVVAWQHLQARRPVKPGHRVLINGAGGSVGMFAIQIARHFGAEVTAVDSQDKLEMLRSIGTDHVLDFKQVDFTQTGQHYDLILDVVVHRWIFDYRRALAVDGIAVMVGGWLGQVFLNTLLGKFIPGKKKVSLGPWKPNKAEDLDSLSALFAAGKLKPVIDRYYPLSEVAAAFRYLASGQTKGKLIITVTHTSSL